ncbi:MAG: dihydrodipicolinate synthase family protein [Candidatus Latescibacteria bacterium]|nr:dihydrodipicolinate synthase family protein [Candidatus Latescibacterota bacterium]
MTPFCRQRNRQGKFAPDLAGMETNTRFFSRVAGDKLLVICGGSGEFHSLTPAEVRALAQAAVAGAAGRCRVICGVGGSTATAAAMARAAQEVGCDAVLVMPHPPLVKQGEAACGPITAPSARPSISGSCPSAPPIRRSRRPCPNAWRAWTRSWPSRKRAAPWTGSAPASV